MANQVIVSTISGLTLPFSGIACDVYGNNCIYVGSGNTFPISFTLPSQFDTAPALQFTITDSAGCETSEILYCSITPSSLPKEFQNFDYFFFMGGDVYQFQ